MAELDVSALIKKYLSNALIMQLATAENNHPWICNLHYVMDDDSNMYWLSKASSRHSTEIVNNSNAGISIAVKSEKPLVGIQGEGVASLVTDNTLLSIVSEMYINRHGSGREFIDSVVSGDNEHKFYVFKPKHFSLFDQDNFPSQPPQEWVVERN